MPLKPIDYSKGIQYKIVCNDPAITDCYNGSTCSLKDRKTNHKQGSRNPNNAHYNLKVYQFIRENGGWENWTFIQLEESPCKSKQELLTRERYWFDLIKPTLNSYSPTFDVEKMKKYAVEYNAIHKEEIKKNKAEYYVSHREEFLEGFREYNANNKDAISARKKEKVNCECGCVSTKYTLSRHQRSQKHLNLMAHKQ